MFQKLKLSVNYSDRMNKGPHESHLTQSQIGIYCTVDAAYYRNGHY